LRVGRPPRPGPGPERRGRSRPPAPAARSRSPGGILPHPHQQLAEVLALQQPDEGLRRLPEPRHDVLAMLEPAPAKPATAVLQEVAHAIQVIRDDEALEE